MFLKKVTSRLEIPIVEMTNKKYNLLPTTGASTM
jgi:hypothetical protein